MIARKIAYNIVISGAAKVLSIALALFAIGLLARYLGPEGFGKYTIALAFFGFFAAIGDLGLHSIAVREISRKDADETKILSKIFTLRLIVSSVIFSLVGLFVWFLPYPLETRQAIFIVAGAFIFATSYTFLNSLFQKKLAMDRVALAELIGKVLQMGVIIALVRYDLGFIYSVLAVLLAMVSNFILIYLFSRKFITLTLSWDPAYWKAFLKKSYPMGISAVATFLYFKIDTILLSLYQGEFAVGIYGAAYKIIETLVFFPAMVIGLVMPLFSRYIFTDREVFLKTANITVKFFLLLIIPLVICVQFLAPEIIAIVAGDQFSASVPLLKILIFALAAIFFAQVFINIVIASNNQKTLMYILVAAACFNIVANLIFIPLYSYTGAAFVSVATEIFVALSAAIVACKKANYTLALHKPIQIIIIAVLMVVVITITPLNIWLAILCGIIAYAVLILWLRVVTLAEIKSIVAKN